MSKLRRALLVALCLCWTANVAAADSKPRYEFNLRVAMRDGTALATDVYRPDAPGRYPVLLIRTPYGKSTSSYVRRGQWWARHGYVFVVQDVRGRGDSDGTFYPLAKEAEDGFDAQDWAGTQSWSNGRVGTLGGSYLGWTQVYAAGLANPHLAAMVPSATPPDPDRNFPLQHGVPLLSAAAWMAKVDGRSNQAIDELDLAHAYETLPTIEMDRRLGRTLPAWRDWLTHAPQDPYWAALRYQDRLLDARAPMLHVTGWYDDVFVGTVENFVNMTTRARTPSARAQQFLLIGPWGHAINAGTRLGDVEFGPTAKIDLDALLLRWFDHWLKGVDTGIEREPRVRLFVMGANRWRDEREWPLARTQYTKLYLHSGGNANGSAGDGQLSLTPPVSEPADRFRYDPAAPVPFLTGLNSRQVGGPDDYREIERRKDLLVYSTDALDRPLEICGPVKLHLYASSSARDTDWTAKLLDVQPDGAALRLNDGIVRARFRNGTSREEFLTPGKVEPYEIDLWSTCIELEPGHRLLLEIASSAATKYDLNLNTGGPIGRETKGVVAEQQVLHDATHPSHLLLPIIPR